jgi:hypothetical protein
MRAGLWLVGIGLCLGCQTEQSVKVRHPERFALPPEDARFRQPMRYPDTEQKFGPKKEAPGPGVPNLPMPGRVGAAGGMGVPGGPF